MGESIKSFKKEELTNLIVHIQKLHEHKPVIFVSSGQERVGLERILRELMKKYGHHYYEFNNFIKPKPFHDPQRAAKTAALFATEYKKPATITYDKAPTITIAEIKLNSHSHKVWTYTRCDNDPELVGKTTDCGMPGQAEDFPLGTVCQFSLTIPDRSKDEPAQTCWHCTLSSICTGLKCRHTGKLKDKVMLDFLQKAKAAKES
jgi:hypothetical protein